MMDTYFHNGWHKYFQNVLKKLKLNVHATKHFSTIEALSQVLDTNMSTEVSLVSASVCRCVCVCVCVSGQYFGILFLGY